LKVSFEPCLPELASCPGGGGGGATGTGSCAQTVETKSPRTNSNAAK
jgi:hypothetical protein